MLSITFFRTCQYSHQCQPCYHARPFSFRGEGVALPSDHRYTVHDPADRGQAIRSGLLQNGGALPRDADNFVSVPALQHVDSAAHDFVDQHTVEVPPGGFPSLSGDNVHAAYAGAKPYHCVQPHVDIRALLVDAASACGGDREWGSGRVLYAELHLRACPDAPSQPPPVRSLCYGSLRG